MEDRRKSIQAVPAGLDGQYDGIARALLGAAHLSRATVHAGQTPRNIHFSDTVTVLKPRDRFAVAGVHAALLEDVSPAARASIEGLSFYNHR